MRYVLILFPFYRWEEWVSKNVSNMYKITTETASKRRQSIFSPCSWPLNYAAFHLSPDCWTCHMSPDILPRVLMPSAPKVGSGGRGVGWGPSTGHAQLYSKQRREESHDHHSVQHPVMCVPKQPRLDPCFLNFMKTILQFCHNHYF